MTITDEQDAAAGPGTDGGNGEVGTEACSRCGRRDGALVHAGWAEWPADVLRRIGASGGAHLREVLVHAACAAA
jgi:hypothetical protein